MKITLKECFIELPTMCSTRSDKKSFDLKVFKILRYKIKDLIVISNLRNVIGKVSVLKQGHH